MVIDVMVEPMKRKLGMSDTQVGLVSRLAFADLHAVCGLPLARVAGCARHALKAFDDKGGRRYLGTTEVAVGIEGKDKPGLIADWPGMQFC